jgi:2-polyprenyl-6-methoxyphenol hydroxylase-like FAD-dependent oxidoreductase
VGLAMAAGLAHHDVKSIVLEEDEELSRHSKAPGILPRTLEIFRSLGVVERFIAEGTFLTRVQVWLAPQALGNAAADRRHVPGAGTPLAALDLDVLRELTAFPGVLILPQDKIERLLYEHVARTGLTDVRFGHGVTGFEQDDSGVSVRVQPRHGQAYELGAKYLIGCDGAHSAVRRSLGWSLEGKTYPTRLMLADVSLPDQRNELPWPRVAPLSEGVLAAIRIEPHLWRIIATVTPEATDEEVTREPAVARRVELLFGPGPFDLVWADVFRIHCRNSPHFRSGGVFLAGDAAHLNSPAGGMGMNSGIQDTHNLAWKLARALGGGGAGNPDREALLASYEEERRPAVVSNVDRYTDLLTRGILIAPTLVRTLFLGAVGIALRRRQIMRRIAPRMAMLDPRYRSRLISGHGRLLGGRAPDGALERGGGRELRLLDLVGREAALLLFDDGRLPGWNVRQVEGLLAGIPELRVYRLLAASASPGGAHDLVDVTGAIRRSWRPGPADTAALIRPDGHVGWMDVRASPEQLQEGVRRALGLVGLP